MCDIHPTLQSYQKLPIDLITGRRHLKSFCSSKSIHVHPASYKGKKCEPSDLPEEHLHVERFHPAAVNKCAGLPKNEDLISVDVNRVHPIFYGRSVQSVRPSKPEKPNVYPLTPSSVLLRFRVPAASGSCMYKYQIEHDKTKLRLQMDWKQKTFYVGDVVPLTKQNKVISGLANGTETRFRLRFKNVQMGWGEWSDYSDVVDTSSNYKAFVYTNRYVGQDSGTLPDIVNED